MLDFSFDDKVLMLQIESEQKAVYCDVCDEEALIFQEEGNYCLNCWQERTEPYITVNRASIET